MQGLALKAAGTFALEPPREALPASKPATPRDKALREQATQFVAGSFFAMLLKAMRDTVPKDGLVSGGRGEEVFRSLFDQELSQRFAEGSKLGVIDAAVRQLSGRAAYRQEMPRRCDDPEILDLKEGRE